MADKKIKNNVETDEKKKAKELAKAEKAKAKEAKKAKNYAEADRIRNELAARGITLIDTKEGTTYKMD